MVLEFRPAPRQDMLVACLRSRWSGPGEPDLLSFAAITDEPPAEVAAAGHDRCIIPIKPENIDAWLNPDPAHLAAQYAILDDRERPFLNTAWRRSREALAMLTLQGTDSGTVGADARARRRLFPIDAAQLADDDPVTTPLLGSTRR